MDLSIKKLYAIISAKSLLPIKFYIHKDRYTLIETISLNNAEPIFIWIPEKYQFPYDSKNIIEKDCTYHKIKKIDINLTNDIVEKYGEKPNYIQQYYPDIELDQTELNKGKNIEDFLLEHYQQPLKIKDSNIDTIKDIYRQLSRLKHCVKYITYKLIIMTNEYLCITTSNESIDCYHIKNSKTESNMKKLYVVISLETLITSENNFENDVKDIKLGINEILEKNSIMHFEKIMKIMDRKDEIFMNISRIDSMKEEGNEIIKKFENLLSILVVKENEILEKINKLNSVQITNITVTQDTERKNQFNVLKEEYDRIIDKKDKAREKILELQDHISNSVLVRDQILFDNIVLLRTILGNIDKLQKIFS